MQEVEEKRKKGEGEQEPESITKSKKQIIRENVLTLFNLLNFIIAGLLFAVGAYTNMIFIAIIILNIVIGIAQECKAKKLVDELSMELILDCCTDIIHLEDGSIIDQYGMDEDGLRKIREYFIKGGSEK